MEQMLSMHANIHFLSVVWKILMEKNKLLLIHSKFDPRGISSTYSLLYPQISANICIFFTIFIQKYPEIPACPKKMEIPLNLISIAKKINKVLF